MKVKYLAISILILFSCSEDEFVRFNKADLPVEKVGNQPVGKEQKPICDPFGNGSTHAGLLAFLYEGQPNWDRFDQYIEDGYKHDKPIILPDFNIPSREFTEGFGHGENKLKDQNGNLLVEWFLLDFYSELSLTDKDEVGYYLLRTTSDDGSMLEVNINDEWIKVLEYNDLTAPRNNCFDDKDQSSRSFIVRMEKGDKLKVRGKYFQGPKTKIAMILSWKKMAELSEYTEPIREINMNSSQCNQNSFKVLKPENYSITGVDC